MKRTVLLLLELFLAIGLLGQVNFSHSNLPIVVINTNGQSIPDEPKINAQMGIIDNGPGQTNHLTDPFNNYNGPIGIERRGSSSQGYEKKPFSIETRDAEGEDLDVSLLGMPEESDWALISPLNDKTLMRDVLAHLYAGKALDWSPRSRYCEVVLNGEYIGVYSLIELIKRNKNRVAIKKLEETDISGDELTGGYILKMDKFSGGGGGGDFVSEYPPYPGAWQQTWFQYHYPKPDNIQPEQKAYIQNFMDEFEDMMAGPDFHEEYADWIDIDSWVEYLLVEELTKNVDGYRLSAYFYKDRDSEDGHIKMGPAWDFNISLGIGDYCGGQDWTGWAKDFNNICIGDYWVIHFWWSKVWSDPTFRLRVTSRWQELRNGPWSNDQLFGAIDSISNLLSEAQVRNFQRWHVLGEYVWPNSFIGNTYQSEVSYLKNWLTNRLGWLDTNIAAISRTDTVVNKDPLVQVYPNPAGNFVFVKLNHPSVSGYSIQFFDMQDRLVYSNRAVSSAAPVQLDWSLAPGIYAYRIIDQLGGVYTGKLAVAR